MISVLIISIIPLSYFFQNLLMQAIILSALPFPFLMLSILPKFSMIMLNPFTLILFSITLTYNPFFLLNPSLFQFGITFISLTWIVVSNTLNQPQYLLILLFLLLLETVSYKLSLLLPEFLYFLLFNSVPLTYEFLHHPCKFRVLFGLYKCRLLLFIN